MNKILIYKHKDDIYMVNVKLIRGFGITGEPYFKIEFIEKNNKPFFKRVYFNRIKIVFGISRIPQCLKAQLYIDEKNTKENKKSKNIYPLLELALTTNEEYISFSDWYGIVYPNYTKDCEKDNNEKNN